MQPKADMVPKECGFNQSQTASCCSPAMARYGELIQTQYFCHHADPICHPNSSYVTTKLYETSACGCNNNTIFWAIQVLRNAFFWKLDPFVTLFSRKSDTPTHVRYVTLEWPHSERAIFTFSTIDVCSLAAKVAKWRHRWIHHFSCLTPCDYST